MLYVFGFFCLLTRSALLGRYDYDTEILLKCHEHAYHDVDWTIGLMRSYIHSTVVARIPDQYYEHDWLNISAATFSART